LKTNSFNSGNMILLALLGAGIYLLWKSLQNVGSQLNQAAIAFSNLPANMIGAAENAAKAGTDTLYKEAGALWNSLPSFPNSTQVFGNLGTLWDPSNPGSTSVTSPGFGSVADANALQQATTDPTTGQSGFLNIGNNNGLLSSSQNYFTNPYDGTTPLPSSDLTLSSPGAFASQGTDVGGGYSIPGTNSDSFNGTGGAP
jgi:hypothetical protein